MHEVNKLKPAIKPLRYENGVLYILDQRELPQNEVWLEIAELEPLLDAVRGLAARGAPLLGIAAGYAVLIGMNKFYSDNPRNLMERYRLVREQIAETRPTARNLFVTLERMDDIVINKLPRGLENLLEAIRREADNIYKEEIESCEVIARIGAPLLENADRVLTHCNTGALATGGVGTALGVIHAAHLENGIETVWVDETRPLLQGARLTAWELSRLDIPYKIICDDVAASLMLRGLVDAVIVGADRITANGDTANKIGTLNLAILCDYFDIPFYIAAPTSTIDMTLSTGNDIEIEQREPREIRGWHDTIWAPAEAPAENPAFDITPIKLITSFITERGIIENPGTILTFD